jgi:hypothetical protein
MRKSTRLFAYFLLVAIGVASQYAQAANFSVNCDRDERINKTLRLIAVTNPQGPNRIIVIGSCKENVKIRSMDRLTMITKTAASITDRSHGSLAVVDIEDSRSVTLQGFTINGGGGVLCNSTSVCYLTGNTIQDGAGTGVGVFADSHAFLESNVIQNNRFRGASVNDRSQMASSNDVFQGNGGQGVAVISGAYFGTFNTTFLNNLVGVEAFLNSTIRLNGGTISGSVCASAPSPYCGYGVVLLGGAQASFANITITANGGSGIHLEDGAFAVFFGTPVTGNLSGTDIECAPQFPITRFVAGTGGITNCVEPASPAQARDSMK